MSDSCVATIKRIVINRGIKVTIDGRIWKILPYIEYRKKLFQICSLILLTLIVYVLKKIPYVPITVTGNTIYAHVIASTLRLFEIKHKVCKSNNRIHYYETTDNKEIPFEGVRPGFFPNQEITIVPLNNAELKELQKHTKYRNLKKIQNNILAKFSNNNGLYSTKMLMNTDDKEYPIVYMRKIGKLYYVETSNNNWITSMILTDDVLPLKPGEMISCICSEITKKSSEQCGVKREDKKCIVTGITIETILFREIRYKVRKDFTIKCINSDHEDESVSYSVSPPRMFSGNIHPFHLPESWDPLLSVMIVTCAKINKLQNN